MGRPPAGYLWCFFSSVNKETAIISNRVAQEASRWPVFAIFALAYVLGMDRIENAPTRPPGT